MKKAILLAFICSLSAKAQLKTKNQPPSDWYDVTVSMHKQKKIKGDSLLKMKPSTFPVGFQDTLRKYDWVDLGRYLYVDKKLSVTYDYEKPAQYDMFRLADGDTVINFSYNTGFKYVTHTNFKDTYWMLPTYTYKNWPNRNN